MLEDYVVNNLSLLFPGLELVSRNERIANKWTFDIHAKDSHGLNYFIEVKNSECNRINIGQIVEYKANIAKVDSEAKIVLVCRDVNTSIKELLKKIGVGRCTTVQNCMFLGMVIMTWQLIKYCKKRGITLLSTTRWQHYRNVILCHSMLAFNKSFKMNQR